MTWLFYVALVALPAAFSVVAIQACRITVLRDDLAVLSADMDEFYRDYQAMILEHEK